MKNKLLVLALIGLIIISVLVSAGILTPAKENSKTEELKLTSPKPFGFVVLESQETNDRLYSSINTRVLFTESANGLERIDFIHYKKGYAKPEGAGSKTPSCYKFLSGAKPKWEVFPVNYVINPSNSQGLSESFVTSAISTSAEAWDSATSSELFNNAYTVDYSAQYGVQNYKNEMSFGNYPNAGVIAVTSIWMNPATKAIIEFDILFDTDFIWGDASVNSGVMDLQNIATHEIGHGVGLGDIYNTACGEVTMYGYSTEGEIKKRSLETPDITGLQKLYG